MPRASPTLWTRTGGRGALDADSIEHDLATLARIVTLATAAKRAMGT